MAVALTAGALGGAAMAGCRQANEDVVGSCTGPAQPSGSYVTVTPNCSSNGDCACGTGGYCAANGTCASCDCDSDEYCVDDGEQHHHCVRADPPPVSTGGCYGAPPLVG